MSQYRSKNEKNSEENKDKLDRLKKEIQRRRAEKEQGYNEKQSKQRSQSEQKSSSLQDRSQGQNKEMMNSQKQERSEESHSQTKRDKGNLQRSRDSRNFSEDQKRKEPPQELKGGQNKEKKPIRNNKRGSKKSDSSVEDQSEDERLKRRASGVNERLATGVIGLDQKIEGGIVRGSMNLLTGKTGTGKTAFSASFIREGALNQEPGIYVTTEERKEDIEGDIKSMFGWDFDELERKNLVKILSVKPIFPSKQIENLNRLVRSYISDLLDKIEGSISNFNAERVVIDSVSVVEMFIKDKYLSRVALASLLNNLRETEVTAILTSTIPESSEALSGGGIIEYLVDGVIKLDFVPVAEEHKRTLSIRKMRRTDHSVMIMPFDITSEGLRLSRVE